MATAPTDTGGFVEETIFFFLLKMATSMDDLIWLSPFVAMSETSNEKVQFALIYAAVCLLVTVEALGLAWATVNGLTLLLNYKADSVGGALKIVGALCIFAFAYSEWLRDNIDVNGDDLPAPSTRDDTKLGFDTDAVAVYGSLNETASSMDEGLASTTSDDRASPLLSQNFDSESHHQQRRRRLLLDLFVVGICGTLDTLAVFFSVLISRSPMRPAPLLIGSALAAVVIIVFAYSITFCVPLARCFQRLPLWALLCVIATYILVSGLCG